MTTKFELIKTASLQKIGRYSLTMEDDGSGSEDFFTDCNAIEVLEHGSTAERKEVLAAMDTSLVKTLLNVIGNVVKNKNFNKRINSQHRRLLKPYLKTYEKLLNDDIKLKDKLTLLKRSGHVYLPTFLEIIGEDIIQCTPEQPTRKTYDCPLCPKKNLKRLANHLRCVHQSSPTNSRRLLRKLRYDRKDEDSVESD